MCGYGTLLYEAVNPDLTGTAVALGYNDYSGTFLNGKFHGVGRQIWENFTYEGEYKEGKRHGWSTVYFKDGGIFNMKHEEGKEVVKKEVREAKEALYGNGLPLGRDHITLAMASLMRNEQNKESTMPESTSLNAKASKFPLTGQNVTGLDELLKDPSIPSSFQNFGRKDHFMDTFMSDGRQ